MIFSNFNFIFYNRFLTIIMALFTQRLELREFSIEDAKHLYQLNLNPDVIRYTGDASFSNISEATAFLKNYDDYCRNGYGRWAMVEQQTGEFLGWCGLKRHTDTNETDLGFRLFVKYWNNGFATEAAKACIDYGFNTLRLNSIIGRAMADNAASIRVLEKIGMRFEQTFDFHGGPGVIYRISANSQGN